MEQNTALAIPTDIGQKMQNIIDDCLPATTGKISDLASQLKIAWGMIELRKLLNHEQVKGMIKTLQDTNLGFLTDRTPALLERNKKLNPYSWDEVRDCIAEGMLKGYRITGNEINIIAGKFYAAKDGKYRQIIEWPGITNFNFSNSAPTYTVEKRIGYDKQIQNVQYADIEVFATWKQDGQDRSIGYNRDKLETIKDQQIFRIRAHGGDDDAVIGKALSKLFSRVLMRISGQVIPDAIEEGTKIEAVETIDFTATGTFVNEATGEIVDPNGWDEFISDWIDKPKNLYKAYLTAFDYKFKSAPDWVVNKAVDKWQMLFPNDPFPLSIQSQNEPQGPENNKSYTIPLKDYEHPESVKFKELQKTDEWQQMLKYKKEQSDIYTKVMKKIYPPYGAALPKNIDEVTAVNIGIETELSI